MGADEMENQKAMRFAREVDQEGERTICEYNYYSYDTDKAH